MNILSVNIFKLLLENAPNSLKRWEFYFLDSQLVHVIFMVLTYSTSIFKCKSIHHSLQNSTMIF